MEVNWILVTTTTPTAPVAMAAVYEALEAVGPVTASVFQMHTNSLPLIRAASRMEGSEQSNSESGTPPAITASLALISG